MIRRLAEPEVQEALGDTPVVLIHGPRQSGKSTLAQAVAEIRGMTYVTLDDHLVVEFALRDPAGFLSAYPKPLAIDEVQRAPGLFLAIKAAVDRRREPGSYLLTGSANVLSLPRVSDSLAGRMEVIDLYPFSQAEIEGSTGGFIDRLFDPDQVLPTASNGDLIDRVVRGGYPEPVERKAAKRRDAWFASYIRTILERDVRDLANIDGLTQMPRLLGLLAGRSGTTLNLAGLSRDAGIAQTTLTRYVDLLRMLFLVQFVPPFSTNPGAQFTKSPKSFIVDSGLQCYLNRLDAAAIRADRTRFGPLLEGFVAMELKKLSTSSDVRPTLLHLRTVRQKEVDFVLESRDGRLVGIEVKAATSVTPSDADGLRFLRELVGTRFVRGVVLYSGDAIIPLDAQITAAPISALWA